MYNLYFKPLYKVNHFIPCEHCTFTICNDLHVTKPISDLVCIERYHLVQHLSPVEPILI